MQDVFTLVGIVCALLVCGGFLLLCAYNYQHDQAREYYRGLLDQLNDTANAIAEHYQASEAISALEVRRILTTLHRRKWPAINDIKDNDAERWRRDGQAVVNALVSDACAARNRELLSNGLAYIVREYPDKAEQARRLIGLLLAQSGK